MTPLLRTDGLSRTVSGREIVAEISIEAARGEVVAIVGPSGCGKTSLLRLINRLDEPTGGTVFLDGADYRTMPPRELRRRVGMVMQRAVLFPGTVADNVRYGPAQRGETLSDDSVLSLLRGAGFDGALDRTFDKLSGGEAQRVSLARTLANRPSILLMDEPTSALDQERKLQIEAVIQDIVRERGLACLWVTHDPAQARRLARRVVALERGRVRTTGTPEEVLG